MVLEKDYFVYEDENREFGYSSESFYKEEVKFLRGLRIVKSGMTEKNAKSLCRRLNEESSQFY